MSCAYVGWCRSNNTGPWHVDPNEMTPEYVDAWRATVAELKERYPDRPLTKEQKRAKRRG